MIIIHVFRARKALLISTMNLQVQSVGFGAFLDQIYGPLVWAPRIYPYIPYATQGPILQNPGGKGPNSGPTLNPKP